MTANGLDELILAVRAALAVAVLVVTDLASLDASVAYSVTIGGVLIALFTLGALIGRHRRWSLGAIVGLGAANVALGTAVRGDRGERGALIDRRAASEIGVFV